MRTQRTIILIIGSIIVVAVGLFVGLTWVAGIAAATLASAIVLVVLISGYRATARPWHARWGATAEEADQALPGDELLEVAGQTTRAISIDADPEAVWPWLAQIGFGRAGWYSYDWIDNDRRPSATTIVEEWQHIAVGDRIAMTPQLGFVVVTAHPGRSLVSLSDDGSTSWCLQLSAVGDHETRLISRFRVAPAPTFPGTLWTFIADPGAFVMERKMLLGIRHRVERGMTCPGAEPDQASGPASSRLR